MCGGSLEKIAFGHRQFQSTLASSHRIIITRCPHHTTHVRSRLTRALNHPRYFSHQTALSEDLRRIHIYARDDEDIARPFHFSFYFYLFCVLYICAVCWLWLMDFCVRFYLCPISAWCVRMYVFAHFVLSTRNRVSMYGIYMRNQCTVSQWPQNKKKRSRFLANSRWWHTCLSCDSNFYTLNPRPSRRTHTRYMWTWRRRSPNGWKLDIAAGKCRAVNALVRRRRH